MGIIQTFLDRFMDEPSRSDRTQTTTEVRAEPNDFLSQEIMQQIIDSVEGHHPNAQVPYSEAKQNLLVVGESFRGEVFEILRRKYQTNPSEEIDEWFSGALIPEPNNPYDSHAVMVILLDQDEKTNKINPLHVGYIDKEHAAKVQPKLITLWKSEKVIPLLMRLDGGTSDRPNFGVFAMAMTSEIQF